MHGLKNLTAQLLRCPGAVRAYGMANCDGDYPTNLAEKSGHWDLKNYMQSYMVIFFSFCLNAVFEVKRFIVLCIKTINKNFFEYSDNF